MYQHALKNNVVLMGRGGNWMMSDVPHALRVRIMAPVENRIEAIVKREGIDTETAREMILQGVDILDGGAVSSRPGSEAVSEEEEVNRLSPVLEALRGEYPESVKAVNKAIGEFEKLKLSLTGQPGEDFNLTFHLFDSLRN